MDGTLISAMRTGAVTGVGAKYLARKDSETVAMIGCGVQARTQLHALKTVFPSLKEVRGYDIWKEAAEKFAGDASNRFNIDAKVADTPKNAVVGADIIVTATMADEPIVKNAWIKQGNYFSHVGSYQEEEYNVVLKSDKIVVDDWEIVKHRQTPILAIMYTQGLIKDEDIYAELKDIVAGKQPGRESDEERIFFSPIGLGAEDVAVAYYIYKKALAKGVGQKLKLVGHK
jgi:ornithine cyclodeaminase